jgi:hypothetical protein
LWGGHRQVASTSTNQRSTIEQIVRFRLTQASPITPRGLCLWIPPGEEPGLTYRIPSVTSSPLLSQPASSAGSLVVVKFASCINRGTGSAANCDYVAVDDTLVLSGLTNGSVYSVSILVTDPDCNITSTVSSPVAVVVSPQRPPAVTVDGLSLPCTPVNPDFTSVSPPPHPSLYQLVSAGIQSGVQCSHAESDA